LRHNFHLTFPSWWTMVNVLLKMVKKTNWMINGSLVM
jgi:hypothetical protein